MSLYSLPLVFSNGQASMRIEFKLFLTSPDCVLFSVGDKYVLFIPYFPGDVCDSASITLCVLEAAKVRAAIIALPPNERFGAAETQLQVFAYLFLNRCLANWWAPAWDQKSAEAGQDLCQISLEASSTECELVELFLSRGQMNLASCNETQFVIRNYFDLNKYLFNWWLFV